MVQPAAGSVPSAPVMGAVPPQPTQGMAASTPDDDAGKLADAATPADPKDGSASEHEPDDLTLTNIDVSNDTKRRFGAPLVAVNPKDPNNIVVLAQSNMGYTRQCVAAGAGSDCEPVPAISIAGIPIIYEPRGMYRTPAFMDVGIFVSFDRGMTWKTVDVSGILPPGHPEINSKGEGPLAVTADGTFYIGYNAMNWGDDQNFFPNAGVGVIKSIDGGMTWNWAGLSQTPADWPYGDVDLSTGTFYVVSGIGFSTLGARSTGMVGAPEGTIGDRWIASTQDGVNWTTPQPLGGTKGTDHVSASHSGVTAARGIAATLFLATDATSCAFFLGGGGSNQCLVFQTSTDAGATWNRHRVPVPADFTPTQITGIEVAADPSTKGHFAAILLDQSGSQFWVYETRDSGTSWTGPIKVSEDTTKVHFSPWVAYSPKGELGLMWRTYETAVANSGASAPYLPFSVWAAISSDGGAVFSQPLKVSKANSPAPPDDPNDQYSWLGDHGPSGIALDGHGHVYVVWADWTPGERSIFFSAISVKAFK